MIEVIREAKEGDIPAVQAIQMEYLHHSYPGNKLLDSLNKFFFVAVVENNVVGYVIADDDGLVDLGVSKSFTKQGIGRRLITHIERELKIKGIKQAKMHIKEDSIYKKFFEDFGYKTKTVVPHYHENGENALFMIKDLE
jgi:ribosomal protein S18 acetylase RimI-like enzyme